MTTVSDLKHLEGNSFRANVQKFGAFLSGMIMPNIGAFIAWGLITALFIEDGWTPVPALAQLVDPMILTLLPLLIAYTGGRMVHGQRGAVIAAVGTMGVIVGTDKPMFLGAMVMGPLAAYLLKKLDEVLELVKRDGFEMLIDNFSLGILGMGTAIGGYYAVGPVFTAITDTVGSWVEFLVHHNLLPLASLFVEPAKVLFLNNAINHGVLTPLGAADVTETGKSILFMVESNPGPGLGLLLAIACFGPGMMRSTAPGAILIHFFGGIHEIYFPYILMKPRLVLATIAGGASGLLTGTLLNAGLVAAASPGSIIAYLAVTPRGGLPPVLAAIGVATAVSFVVASALLGFGKARHEDDEEAAPEDVPAATDPQTTGA